MYVGNRVSDKLEPIHQRIYCQRYHTQISFNSLQIRYLFSHQCHCQICEILHGHSKVSLRIFLTYCSNELGSFPPVESAANVMREIIYSNKNSLSASMICSGWDPYKGYQIYQVNSSGYFEQGNWALSGSGGTFIWGYIDANYRENMSKHEVKEFIKSCIALACFRDSSSGGCIRLLDITKEAVEREYIPYSDFKIK